MPTTTRKKAGDQGAPGEAAGQTGQATGAPATNQGPPTTGGRRGATQVTQPSVTQQEGTSKTGGGVKPKLAEAVKKKLKTAIQVENLTLSEGVQLQGLSEEADATSLAKMMLLHHGFGEDEGDLHEASEYWGLALWEIWRQRGKDVTADWMMLATLCKVTIVIISSAKEVRYPTGATATADTALFVARGANDFYFVTLHPARKPKGRAEEFVTSTLQRWETERKPKGSEVVTLMGSDDDDTMMTKKKRSDSKEGKRIGAEKRSRESDSEEEENNFKVMKAHPVLNTWGQFETFRLGMRTIATLKKQIGWTDFIGEEIIEDFELVYNFLYSESFEATRVSKAEFLKRVEEICNFQKNILSAKERGEPRLHEDPEGVADFSKEYKAYLKRECVELSGGEKCEKLLRAIDDKHRQWAAEIRKKCKLFQGEDMAAKRLIMIFERLEELAEAELVGKKGKDTVDKNQGRQGDRGAEQGSQQDRGFGRARSQNFERRGLGQDHGYQQQYQPMWQGGNNAGFIGMQQQNGYQPTFIGGVAQQQQFAAGPMYAQGATPMPYPAGGMGYTAGGMAMGGGMQYPVGGMTTGEGAFPPGGIGGQQQGQQGYRGNQQWGQGQQLPPGGGRGMGGGLPRRHGQGGQGGRYSCFNCGEEGHLSTQCTQPKRCKDCGSTTHLSWACDGSGPKGKTAAQQDDIEKSKEEQKAGDQPQYVPKPLGGRAGNKVLFNQASTVGAKQPGQGI
jgi:hypothetical protein